MLQFLKIILSEEPQRGHSVDSKRWIKIWNFFLYFSSSYIDSRSSWPYLMSLDARLKPDFRFLPSRSVIRKYKATFWLPARPEPDETQNRPKLSLLAYILHAVQKPLAILDLGDNQLPVAKISCLFSTQKKHCLPCKYPGFYTVTTLLCNRLI